MIKYIKKLLGLGKKAPEATAPYKVEAPTVETAPAKKKPTVKKATTRTAKPAVVAKTARKPKTPKV